MLEFSKSSVYFATIIFLITFPFSCFPQSSITIDVGTISNHTILFEKLSKDDNCLSMENYSPKWTRVVADFIVLCNALHAGGIKPKFVFHNFPNEGRRHIQLLKGQISMPISIHRVSKTTAQTFYISDVIVKHKETEVGIYALPSNLDLLQSKSLAELREFSGVTNHSWLIDIDVLSQIGSPLQTVSTYNQMFQMVAAQRVDYLLTFFSPLDDFSRTVQGFKLVPVPNVKIVLPGSRYFIVNKKAPNADIIFQALQKGLKKLRNKEFITYIYQKIGFFNPKVKSWPILCCDKLTNETIL